MAIVSGRENGKMGSHPTPNSESFDSFAFQLTHPRPSGFGMITRTPRACASYPSCVAVYPRDSRSRRVLCRSTPVGFVVSRLLPPRSTATWRLYRPCRSSHSLRSPATAGRLSTAFNIRTGHRQRLVSGIISRSGEVTTFGFQAGPFLNVHKIRDDSDNKR